MSLSLKRLEVEVRHKTGKGPSRAVRGSGRVPAIVYGEKQAPVSITLDFKTINHTVYSGHFLSTVFLLNIEGKDFRVIPRDYQMHPVKDLVTHVDFLRLGLGSKIKVEIPVHVKGSEISPGIKRGGTVNLVEHLIECVCDSNNIPSFIDIDISSLGLNASIHLKNVAFPPGTAPTAKDDLTILSIVPPSNFDEAVASSETSTTTTDKSSSS